MATQAFMLRAAAFWFQGQRGLSVELGTCNLSGGHRKRKDHLKLTSLSNHAAHFDAAMMFFHDMGTRTFAGISSANKILIGFVW